MRIELTGSDTATCGEYSVTSKVGTIGKLARILVRAGFSGDAEIYHNGTKCFKDAPILAWADMSTSETDNVSVRFVKYRPFPLDGVAV